MMGKEPLGMEEILFDFIQVFEKYYEKFTRFGFGIFLDEYYKYWLHNDQLVLLNDDVLLPDSRELKKGTTRVRIVGIELGYGLLEAVDVSDEGIKYQLQPDGNSFDMMQGLLKRKFVK